MLRAEARLHIDEVVEIFKYDKEFRYVKYHYMLHFFHFIVAPAALRFRGLPMYMSDDAGVEETAWSHRPLPTH